MVFEAIVFWVMFLIMGAVVSAGMHKRGIAVWMGAGVWRLIAVAVVVKAADTTVTVWAYAHGLGWAEANPTIGTLDAYPDFTVWVIPQMLMGYALAIQVAFAALLAFTPMRHLKTKLLFLFFWTFSIGMSAFAPMSWAIPLFFYEGVGVLP